MIFADSYEPIPEAGCWIWMRGCISSGYGYLWQNGKMVGAHRESWRLHRGEIPAGAHVLHRCDVPSCVNPAHLFLGDQASNTRDMDAKGRRVNSPQLGEKHGCVKLRESDVLAIRSDQRPSRAIAKDYGLDKSTVLRIKSRANWRHI